MTAPGRWRAGTSWVNEHPRHVGTVYVVLGAVWIAVDLLAHEPSRLVFPVLFTLAGISWFGRVTTKVEGSTLTVPNRFWGGRRVEAREVEAIEIPESVWATGPSRVLLRNGERLVLRPADRARARTLAEQLAVAVVPLREG